MNQDPKLHVIHIIECIERVFEFVEDNKLFLKKAMVSECPEWLERNQKK